MIEVGSTARILRITEFTPEEFKQEECYNVIVAGDKYCRLVALDNVTMAIFRLENIEKCKG